MISGRLTELKGIGEKVEAVFIEAGIQNISDLLQYFPRDYHDYSKITLIKDAVPGNLTLRCHIEKITDRYVKRGMHITEASAVDATGGLRLTWFNQPYRKNSIKLDKNYFVTGKLEYKSGRYAITNPSIELEGENPIHTARVVPIYRETKGLKNTTLRKAIFEAIKYLPNLKPLIPEDIIKEFRLMDYSKAVRALHFPEGQSQLDQAKHTMSFIEIFELMLASDILKSENMGQLAPRITFEQDLAKRFVSKLQFELTDSQRKVMWQILKDIDSPKPMNRLVEGDVGSGKTVVAAMAIAMAVAAKYQTAYLAPTEILAKQHFETLGSLMPGVGVKNIDLLIGSLKPAIKKETQAKLSSGKTELVIGTHSLLQGLEFKNLGLIVIDEQHRFGVEQRAELLKHNSLMPHILSMTATPIPRSLALTLYGELDISIIDAMPIGRKPVITEIASPNSRESMNRHIEEEIAKGHQVYVVCPLIESGSKLEATNVETIYKKLSSTFKHRRVAILHGKMKSDEKDKVMNDFVSGNIDILVSTTVIEVGVNVPNASVMIIEGAERFGLAQMHQLRGRVGRSSDQAYCYLVPSDSQAPSKRIRAFARINDGFKLAELDLELRGPGAIYGKSQHGALDLRFASLSDHRLIRDVRQAVKIFKDSYSLNDFTELTKRVRLAQAVITLN